MFSWLMFRPISDYGIIGNMQSAALVSRDGSIDYCSLPYFDSPTVFAALLDDEKGGLFSLQPDHPFSATREYLPDTNILATTFQSADSHAVLFDFMPVDARDSDNLNDHRLHRCLTVKNGKMNFVLRYAPRPEYATIVPRLSARRHSIALDTGHIPLTLFHSLDDYSISQPDRGTIELRFSLEARQNARFQLAWGNSVIEDTERELRCRLQENIDFWHSWLNSCSGLNCMSDAVWRHSINRSLLILKLLTFQPTGAIAAAATTSLPESPGGERNWDYRFTWIRDASFTLKAFFALGHINEADHFIRWLHTTYSRYGGSSLNIMYSLRGDNNLEEHSLNHLKGYMDSRPVRTGNLAHTQNQWDIYGEVMDSALRLSDYAGKIDEALWPFFVDICNLACRNWRQPDDGIWEVRNGPAHFVYSKVMCWVALDRGIIIAKRFGFDAPVNSWIESRQQIREDILQNGFDSRKNSFVQRYGSTDLDASLLLLPLVNFLPADDPRIQGTIDACMNELMADGFLLRYRSDDGLEGREGGFVLCNFWLIETLALCGRTSEARQVLDTTLEASNDLGIFSEEYDRTTGMMLGNVPQAFSHIGFINAVTALQYSLGSDNISKPRPSLAERLRKLIPLTVTLNETAAPASPPPLPSDPSAELKKQLVRLQGGFFDSRTGQVDYRLMKRSPEFMRYRRLAAQLKHTDLGFLDSDNAKKAFWINIYNILIIDGVIEFDIEHSVLEIANFFQRITYAIDGMHFSPDDIEHGILRRNRPHPALPLKPFRSDDPRRQLMVESFDPRIHFALVCASSSCPPIEFYDHRQIDRQLDIAARSFINRNGLELQKERLQLRLSRIFLWYGDDFGGTTADVVRYAASFADSETARWISRHLDDLHVSYLPYNWNLNSALG
ncbi:glycoside hydrolase family 15 protein [Prosthecochloris ethylica]|nr:glycoside hydrolase family 15 protein [Prosthecochloris ethylica]